MLFVADLVLHNYTESDTEDHDDTETIIVENEGNQMEKNTSEIVEPIQRSTTNDKSFGQMRILFEGDPAIGKEMGQTEATDERDENSIPHGNFSSRMAGGLQDRYSEFEDFSKFSGDQIRPRSRIHISVSENTNLFLPPGGVHPVYFDVTNYYSEVIRCSFIFESRIFRIYNQVPVDSAM